MAGYGTSGSFIIGDTGESFIIAEWHPDPKILEQQILQMADEFGNWTEPLMEARQVMIEDTRARFRTETDPDGNSWQELNEDYQKEKLDAGYPDEILVREDVLRPAATSESAWFVDERSIYFNEGVLPKYGPLHQEGTESVGKYHQELQGKALTKIISGGVPSAAETKQLGRSGRGLNLPARPFVGMSETAENEIEAIFINHLYNTVEREWGRDLGPYGHGYGSNVLGRFPILGFTRRGQPMLHVGPPRGQRFGRMY